MKIVNCDIYDTDDKYAVYRGKTCRVLCTIEKDEGNKECKNDYCSHRKAEVRVMSLTDRPEFSYQKRIGDKWVQMASEEIKEFLQRLP